MTPAPAARALGAALALALTTALPARADRVVVKGTALEGTVVSISSKVVEMKTIYGDGTLKLKLSDVTAIETEGVFHVYHGDAEATGRAIAVEGETLRVGDALGRGEPVAVGAVVAVQNERPGEGGLFDRLELAYPYWSGNFDLSLNYLDSTVNSLNFATGFALRRDKAPSRFLLGASYYRSTSESSTDDDESVLASELRGFTRYEYDLTPRLFAFGSLEGEHDGVERLSVRAVPKAGLGYKLWQRAEKSFFAVDAGGAWVYERYFGGDTNDYFGAAFGAQWAYELPYGALWTGRVDYVPSVDDWLGDYIARGETSFLFPLSEHFAFKTTLIDLYDATPAEGAESNSFQTLVGVSVLF
jgi:putative salt-induced outer membrane protein YdiY